MKHIIASAAIIGMALLVTSATHALAQQAACITTGTSEKSGYVPDQFTLTFHDEFDDTNINRFSEEGKNAGPGNAPAWRSRNRHPRFTTVNQEKQIYVDKNFKGTGTAPLGINPFSLENGCLYITASKLTADQSALLKGKKYASGIITTERSFSQKYGYFEARLMMPEGLGFWPAFWLLPEKEIWPPEIDILEGAGHRPMQYHIGTIEPDATAPSKRRAKTKWISTDANLLGSFHTFGLLWNESGVTYYLDGKEQHHIDAKISDNMYILLNLALGSHDQNWIPDPDATTPFPSSLVIDYVRAYQAN